MVRVVFMGSPEFAVPSLRALVDGGQDHGRLYQVVGVVTQPDRPAGRGKELRAPPVKILAQDLGLQTLQPEKLHAPDAMNQLRLWSPDVIVVAAFGQILRTDVLALPPRGCINVHASLLPRWRGAAPIQAAILAGDSESGITIMKMDRGVDTGGILSQRGIPTEGDDTSESLSAKLSRLGADLLVSTLRGYLSGEMRPQAQDDTRATHAPMLKKKDGLLDFALPAADLERRVRALNPWPGAYFIWSARTLQVYKARVEATETPAGWRRVFQGEPALGTGSGLLVLDEVQLAGRKRMSGKSFLAGANDWES